MGCKQVNRARGFFGLPSKIESYGSLDRNWLTVGKKLMSLMSVVMEKMALISLRWVRRTTREWIDIMCTCNFFNYPRQYESSLIMCSRPLDLAHTIFKSKEIQIHAFTLRKLSIEHLEFQYLYLKSSWEWRNFKSWSELKWVWKTNWAKIEEKWIKICPKSCIKSIENKLQKKWPKVSWWKWFQGFQMPFCSSKNNRFSMKSWLPFFCNKMSWRQFYRGLNWYFYEFWKKWQKVFAVRQIFVHHKNGRRGFGKWKLLFFCPKPKKVFWPSFGLSLCSLLS